MPINNYDLLNIQACSFNVFWNSSRTQTLLVSCRYWVVPLISTRVSGYSHVILLEPWCLHRWQVSRWPEMRYPHRTWNCHSSSWTSMITSFLQELLMIVGLSTSNTRSSSNWSGEASTGIWSLKSQFTSAPPTLLHSHNTLTHTKFRNYKVRDESTCHYGDVMMSAMASQITSLTIVCSNF